jgi:excisionase family DNA binding protein
LEIPVSTQPLLLSISDAASLLGLTEQQVYQLTRRRSRVRQSSPIPFVKLGKRLAFRRESLERWIAELETGVRQ